MQIAGRIVGEKLLINLRRRRNILPNLQSEAVTMLRKQHLQQQYNHGRKRYNAAGDVPFVPVRFTNVYCHHCQKLFTSLTQRHAAQHGYKTPEEMIFLGGAEVRNG